MQNEEKLKTFKEFENEEILGKLMTGYGLSSEYYEFEVLYILKKEAIKWIKAIETCKVITSDYGAEPYEYPVSWIKHFFNITDEELE